MVCHTVEWRRLDTHWRPSAGNLHPAMKRDSLKREFYAEFLGTFVLIAFGSGVVAQVVLSGGQNGSYFSINFAWGLAVTMGIYVAGGVTGETLQNLAGYRIHYGTNQNAMVKSIEVASAGQNTFTVQNLPPGTYFFAVRAFTAGSMAPEDFQGIFHNSKIYCPRGETPGFLALHSTQQPVIPMFSTLKELRSYAGKESRYFVITGAEVLDLLPSGYGFVIDIEGDHRVVFDAKAVDEMVDFAMRRMYG